ncbi:MAG: diaminopimelate epimerase, partial [Solirubrobacterales bacterium]|nr:diaminopimelate epimerase [Solirubrobacterales bacterium]
MRFEKWQALGNDYLIVERDELAFELTPARIRRLCDAHFGVFADGVLLLSAPQDPAHVADLQIFNPDGSEAELSGNGAREAILYLRHRGWTDRDTFSIHTAAGTITPQITGPNTCRVDMGRARDEGTGEIAGYGYQQVNVGNPQCAIRVDSEAELASIRLGDV